MAASITYLIPTHERPGYLRRALDYYGKVDAPLLVADSSARALPEAEAGGLGPRVAYRHTPGLGYLPKLAQAARLVETPFVVLCADDDFTVPSAVDACRSFLEANLDYASAQGDYLNAMPEIGGVRLRPAYPQAPQVLVEADAATERMLELQSPYVPTYYAVHRAHSLRDYVRLAEGLENYNLLEMLFALVAAAHGKHKRLPLLYSVREVVPSVAAMDPRRRHGLGRVSEDPAYAAEYGRFVNAMAELLAGSQGLEPEKARRAVREAVALFAARYCGQDRRRGFWRRLPGWLRRAGKRLSGRTACAPDTRAADEAAVRELLAGAGPDAARDLEDILVRIGGAAREAA